MDKTERHQQLAEAGLAGLKRAQEFAWQRAVETGTPFIICKDGKLVDMNPATNGDKPYAEVAELEPTIVREEPEED